MKWIAAALFSVMAASVQPPGQDPLRLGRTLPDGRTRIERIAIDDYIAQVLAGEGQPRAADAAQEALAITARTFAIANRNRHRSEGFDLCDTTHCQVLRPATATTRRAAEATSGRMLLHQGQPAFVFYSAWCGGHTELASQLWPGAVEYANGSSLDDDSCEDEPAWTSEVRTGDIERALRAAGLRGSRLRGLRVLARNESERVARIRVDGFTPSEMSGHEFRMAVGRVAGWQSIKSTAFDIDRTKAGYRFRGRGYGHGVGLCVIGAGKRASRGASAEEILKFYFPGLTVGPVSASARTTSSELRRDAAGPATTTAGGGLSLALPGGDVLLALPGGEEGERSALMSLIRRTRAEIAKQTGVQPANLRVTVHPNVESFGRATGQPWWVSGATDGASIDLLPINVLRQQGQVDRTVRHEVAHALLDGALAKRPMWVREGAAAYFAARSRHEARGTRHQTRSGSLSDGYRVVEANLRRGAARRLRARGGVLCARDRGWQALGSGSLDVRGAASLVDQRSRPSSSSRCPARASASAFEMCPSFTSRASESSSVNEPWRRVMVIS